jgi:hypothetical protein
LLCSEIVPSELLTSFDKSRERGQRVELTEAEQVAVFKDSPHTLTVDEYIVQYGDAYYIAASVNGEEAVRCRIGSKPVAEQEEFPDYVGVFANTDIVDATTGKIDIYAMAKRAERIRAKIENNIGNRGLAQYESLLSTELGKPGDPPLFRHPPLGFSLLKDSARWCNELCELLGRQEIPLAKQAAIVVASEYELRDDEYIVIFGTGYYVCVRVGNQEEVRFRLRNTEEIDIDVALARISADPALAKAVQNMLVKTIRDTAYRTYRDSGFVSKEQGQ